MTVQVYEITNGGVTTYRWLCDACRATGRTAAAFTVKTGMPLPAGSPCDDCTHAEQNGPGYRTPTVDYVPANPESYLPPPGFAARQPGSRKAERWVERLARLRGEAKRMAA